MWHWVTQLVIGIPLGCMPNFIYMFLRSSQIPLVSWSVLCSKSLFSLLVCLYTTDIVL